MLVLHAFSFIFAVLASVILLLHDARLRRLEQRFDPQAALRRTMRPEGPTDPDAAPPRYFRAPVGLRGPATFGRPVHREDLEERGGW